MGISQADRVERLQEWADRAADPFHPRGWVCTVSDALIADMRSIAAELATSRATCARLQEEREAMKLRMLREARIFEPSMDGYGGAMAVVAAAFPEDDYSQVDLIHIAFSVAATPIAKRAELAEAQVATLTAELDDGYRYLARVFVTVAPQCEPLSTLLGVCTQIDNYICGLRDERATLTAALRRYGQHEKGCDVLLSTNELHGVCTCGFAAVLRAASEDQE